MDAYEQLKAFSRNNEKMTKDQVDQFIDSLDVNEKIKEELRQLDVTTY